MDVITETSLEALLQRATDYRNKNTDTAAIDAFCGIIKKEPGGPQIATKLIAARIQSTEEWEALQALTVLETCMKNCGSSFHSEIGKFRFLNEMIKLVSPKFLGPRTPPSVRSQVLKMMHNWTALYPKEHKIKEAYDMLIKQGVIQKSDVTEDENAKPTEVSLSQKGNPIFQDVEKVKLLQKLLHSKNPNDLQAANRLIKTMVKEDEKRVEIKSKRISEVERVRNNVRLLSEMLDSYLPNQSSVEELELINELHQSCERLKPNLVRLASEVQDSDEFLNQVVAVSDELNQVLEKYVGVITKEGKIDQTQLGIPLDSKNVSALLDLTTPTEELVQSALQNGTSCPDILSQPIFNSGMNIKSPLDSIISPVNDLETMTVKNKASLNPLDAVFSSIDHQSSCAGPSFVAGQNPMQSMDKSNILEKNKKVRALEELDVLSETLLQQCKINALAKNSSKETVTTNKEPDCVELNTKNDVMNTMSGGDDDTLVDLSDGKEPAHSDSDLLECQTEEPTVSPKKDVTSLTDLFVSLETIKPSSIPPINVIEERNGISVTIHVARDTPKEDVSVCVVTTLNKNPSPLTNYLFQAVVPKGCKLKLQPPSGSELPAHNPFLPPAAITQIMLIANPNKVNLTLKCMLSYMMQEETFTEMGEVERLITTT
ncbi:hypothetical protein RUM43_005550 [Polyplax serrata]|uniref:ADP-ribosylation factor-binding protein GGA1 n=1 Tax=Polyplax serrata TaxID=468196 RepID=A0AAN8RUR9_POLSC